MDNNQNNQAVPRASKTNSAKDAIKNYLDARAASDPLFATSYAKPKKSIDECFNYILNEARKRGTSVCLTDDEVFGLAVHYYDEDDIKVGTVPHARVSTSRDSTPAVKLTAKEKAAAREAARIAYERQCFAEEAAKEAARKKAEAERKARQRQERQRILESSPTLFD